MSTKFWGFLCFLIRIMFGSLVVYLTHLAPHVHFQCFGHALHIATSCTHPPLAHTFATLVMRWSIPYFFILACHVYRMLCSILFRFRFELHFLIHLAPLLHHYHCLHLHLLPSFFLDHLSIRDKKGGEYTLESIPECFCHFYMILVHTLRGRNSISRAHL